MLSTEIDARIMRENSNDLEDSHRFGKSGVNYQIAKETFDYCTHKVLRMVRHHNMGS